MSDALKEEKYLRASIPRKGPVVGIDLDGVVANLDAVISLNDRKQRWRLWEKGLFLNLPLIEGAREGVEFLNKNFEIYFVSSPLWGNDFSWMEKKQWVENRFPEIGHKKLILTHNKSLFSGDYLIDDRVANGVADFKGTFIHFGKVYKTWKDVEQFFRNIKDE